LRARWAPRALYHRVEYKGEWVLKELWHVVRDKGDGRKMGYSGQAM
jgi:hypothetical protein